MGIFPFTKTIQLLWYPPFQETQRNLTFRFFDPVNFPAPNFVSPLWNSASNSQVCQSLRIVDHKNWTCKEKLHYASHDGSVCHDRAWHKVVPQFVSVQLVYKYYNVWVFGGYIELVIGILNQLTSLRGAPPNATWPPSTTSPEICQHQPHGFGSVNFGVSNTRLRLQIHQNTSQHTHSIRINMNSMKHMGS